MFVDKTLTKSKKEKNVKIKNEQGTFDKEAP